MIKKLKKTIHICQLPEVKGNTLSKFRTLTKLCKLLIAKSKKVGLPLFSLSRFYGEFLADEDVSLLAQLVFCFWSHFLAAAFFSDFSSTISASSLLVLLTFYKSFWLNISCFFVISYTIVPIS